MSNYWVKLRLTIVSFALWSAELQEQVHLIAARDLKRAVLTVVQGRTTFVNTLCGKKVLVGKDSDDHANAHVEEGVRIKPVTVGMLILPILSLEQSSDCLNF